jgi:hypothetical protein
MRVGAKPNYENCISLPSGRSRKCPLLTIGTLVVGALAAYQMAEYVIKSDFAGMAYAGTDAVLPP